MPREYRVVLSGEAISDWRDLHEWVAHHDSPERAEQLSQKIERAIASLAAFPERGCYTKELLEWGVRRYRETYFKPYRIIYTVDQDDVNVHLIADGRRDMQTLLQKRLLRP
jgi:toxin ParE1/3/4